MRRVALVAKQIREAASSWTVVHEFPHNAIAIVIILYAFLLSQNADSEDRQKRQDGDHDRKLIMHHVNETH